MRRPTNRTRGQGHLIAKLRRGNVLQYTTHCFLMTVKEIQFYQEIMTCVLVQRIILVDSVTQGHSIDWVNDVVPQVPGRHGIQERRITRATETTQRGNAPIESIEIRLSTL